MMSKRPDYAKEENLTRRVFAILLSWMRVVLIMSCVLCFLVFFLAAMEGRTLACVVAKSVAMPKNVVPAWPIGI